MVFAGWPHVPPRGTAHARQRRCVACERPRCCGWTPHKQRPFDSKNSDSTKCDQGGAPGRLRPFTTANHPLPTVLRKLFFSTFGSAPACLCPYFYKIVSWRPYFKTSDLLLHRLNPNLFVIPVWTRSRDKEIGIESMKTVTLDSVAKEIIRTKRSSGSPESDANFDVRLWSTTPCSYLEKRKRKKREGCSAF